jgi:hypothetical protein
VTGNDHTALDRRADQRRRLRVGRRLEIYLEPRDIWVGVYVAEHAVFICPLPFLVLRWFRG